MLFTDASTEEIVEERVIVILSVRGYGVTETVTVAFGTVQTAPAASAPVARSATITHMSGVEVKLTDGR